MHSLRRILKQFSDLKIHNNGFHTAPAMLAWYKKGEKELNWLEYNKKIYPPQSPEEEPRPAYVCHVKPNIKYSPWKMWYIACLVRGMPVDEAIKQLQFVLKKGGAIALEAIKEAKELAVKEHNVEHASNLWVAESFVGKGPVVKGLRRHARKRQGLVEYFYCHYFIRLEEGTPPEHYYPHRAPKAPSKQLEEWVEGMRRRKIYNSL